MAHWIRTPDTEPWHPHHVGDIIKVKEDYFRIVGMSTIQLKVRPLNWWERIWVMLAHQEK